MEREQLMNAAKQFRDFTRLPSQARNEFVRDKLYGLRLDAGIGVTVDAAIRWLCRAQDHSASRDGGVARHYSLVSGWGASYPETTGYIVPTMLDYAREHRDPEILRRARAMLDWLVGIQLPDGGFQGGGINSRPVVPVVFNTGQILLGLAKGASLYGEAYGDPMRKAARWLAASQDDDGCWRKHASPFAGPGEKSYDTHVAWGLFEAARVAQEEGYAESALRNVRWALTKQHGNGWFDACCLTDSSRPLTHTIGYALRGVLEAYRFTRDRAFLERAMLTAEGLLGVIDEDGFVPGRLDCDWNGAASYACLTGSSQIACCWLLLYEETGDKRLCDAAFLANGYVRRTVRLDGDLETQGAIKGSFPISGDYAAYQYLNWAAKFFVDANLLEQRVRGGQRAPGALA